MTTRQPHGEPERREGLGGRVRRFIDTELGRALDKDHREVDSGATDHPREPEPAPASARTSEFGRTPEPDRTPALDRTFEPDPTPDPGRTPTPEPGPTPGLDRTPELDQTPGTGKSAVRSSDQTVADGSAQQVGLLDDPAGLRDEWQRVQGTFVDDPQRAVHEASVLVDQTLQEIHRNVTRGQISDPTSTEDLRVSFQRYREFFHRLLSA